MAKRLSSIPVLAAIPVRMGPVNESVSVSCRSIDNGYVTTICKTGADNKYTHREFYSRERPDIQELASHDGPSVGDESMRGATKELDRRD